MKTKHLLLSLTLLACSTSLWAIFPPATGAGTSVSPYVISNATDLIDFRLALNTNNAAALATGLYIELGSNIDLTGATAWNIPAGGGNTFKGTFDGKGFKISGLTIGSEATPFAVLYGNGSTANFGFFGATMGATVKNVSLDIAYYVLIDLDTQTIWPGSYMSVGGVIGQIAGTATTVGNVIDNCKVTGTISTKIQGGAAGINTTASAIATGLRIGGIAGNVNTAEPYMITNCATNLKIVAINDSRTTNATQGSTAGGIIGENLNSASLSIVNCSAAGSVYARNEKTIANAGGIAGNRQGNTANCEIINCLATNSVEAIGKTNAFAGGIVSNTAATISPIFLNVKNNIALNTFIYSKSAAATNPVANRIGAKGASVTFADNNTLNALDIKVWNMWDGTTGTSTTPTIVEDAAGTNGLMLDATDPATQALTKLNAYTTSNPNYVTTVTTTPFSAGTPYNYTVALSSWKSGGAGNNPVLNNLFTGLSNKVILPTMKFSVNNGVLSLKEIDGVKKLNIFTVSGSLVQTKDISDSYSTTLPKGIYMVSLRGSAIQKVVVL